MIESNKKLGVTLATSVALNIFLAAFMLGHVSNMPPLPPEHGGAWGMGREHHHHGGPDGMAPPPPFFAPGELFTQEEMKQDAEQMHSSFEAAQALRKAFAERLQKGSISKEEALAHFAEVDRLMDNTKKHMQEKVAEKIAAMNAEERSHFAEALLKRSVPGNPGNHQEPPAEAGKIMER